MDEENKKYVSPDDFETYSEYYTYIIEHPESRPKTDDEIEEEKRKKEEELDAESATIVYYRCNNKNCNNLMQSKEAIPNSQIGVVKDALKEMRCTKCGSKGFTVISKEEHDKQLVLNKKALKEEKEKARQDKKLDIRSNKALIYIEIETEKLFKDLSDKLQNGDISPERFVALFYNCNFLILKSASRKFDIPNFDWQEHKKTIKDMSEEVLRLYKVQKSEEEILLSYDIKADEIYDVYEENYIEGNEEAFIEYKQSKRLNDYMRKLEEKNSNRYLNRQEGKSERIQDKLEYKFENALKANVKDFKKVK